MQSLGRVEEAVDAYRDAVDKDPGLHVCHANLAALHSYKGNRALARFHFLEARKLDPSNPMYVDLGKQLQVDAIGDSPTTANDDVTDGSEKKAAGVRFCPRTNADAATAAEDEIVNLTEDEHSIR